MFHRKQGFTKTNQNRQSAWGKYTHPTPIVSRTKTVGVNVEGGIINFDEELKANAKKTLTEKENAYNVIKKKYNVDDKAKKKDFKTTGFDSFKDARKELKKAQKSFDSAKEACDQTQRAVDDLKNYYIEAYNTLMTLEDEMGNCVSVYITSFRSFDQPARTLIDYKGKRIKTFNPNSYNTKEGKYTKIINDAILIEIDDSVNPSEVGEKLAHEYGHINHMILNKESIKRSNSALNCREDQDHPFVKSALKAERDYIAKKRKKDKEDKRNKK